MDWPAVPYDQLAQRVQHALASNTSYRRDTVLGLPGSVLDQRVFPPLPELSPFALLQTWMENPNHIGCHTLGESEPGFAGTHALEREVIDICARGLLGAEPDTVDGYLASGGTESNIQALWTFRNALRNEGVAREHIAILCSSDTHYSVAKAADLLDLPLFTVPVDDTTREMTPAALSATAADLGARGVTHVLVVLTMGTTMFGSVDVPDRVLPVLEAHGLTLLVHVDAAFGGFVYPLTTPDQPLTFADPRLLSFTLDAHKMLQAPYGTGIHLIRKGLIQHVLNADATYVPGLDCTLSGSRSGANAVAVWMILNSYGRAGGEAFCAELMARTDHLCAGLTALGIAHYRHAGLNVVTMRAEHVPTSVAERFGLVADDSHAPRWFKVVVMDHVQPAQLHALLDALTPVV